MGAMIEFYGWKKVKALGKGQRRSPSPYYDEQSDGLRPSRSPTHAEDAAAICAVVWWLENQRQQGAVACRGQP